MGPLFTLTDMTGREAAEQRSVVIGTVELNWRLWLILIAGALPSLLAVGVAWPLFGQFALIAAPIVEGIAIWLFYRRAADGMQLRTYQSIYDKRRALRADTWYLCGSVLNPSGRDIRMLRTGLPPITTTLIPRPIASAGVIAPDTLRNEAP